MKFKPEPDKQENKRRSSASIYLPAELYNTLTATAEKVGTSKTGLVRQMIRHCLKEMEVDVQ